MTVKSILFLLTVFLANIIQCITGFAGTVLAMPPSIMLVGYETAKPILNVLGIVASLGVVGTNFKSINKKEFIKITLVMLVGIVCGIFISDNFSLYADILYKALGVTVIVFAIMNWVKAFGKKQDENKSSFALTVLLILSGLIHGIFVCGGPLLVTYASSKLKDTNEFRATLSAVWIVLNGIIFVFDINNGYFIAPTVKLLLISIAVLTVTIVLGNIICRKLSKNSFLIITYILMIISGISLLVK